MGSFSIWHWLVVLAVVLVIFGGRGKIASLFSEIAKGLRSFKKGLNDDLTDHGKENFNGKNSLSDQDDTDSGAKR